MAYFSFTQDILQGKRITEYRKNDGTELQVLRLYLPRPCLLRLSHYAILTTAILATANLPQLHLLRLYLLWLHLPWPHLPWPHLPWLYYHGCTYHGYTTMATLTMAILPWQRDFTYVSDIVEGIIAASELGSQLEVFNLGNTRPEKVSRVHISTRASSR